MRSSFRASAPFLALAVGSACFADPPASSSDTATGSTTDDATSDGMSSTGGVTESSLTTVSTSVADATSTADATADATGMIETTDADSSSTGAEPPECGCPPSNVFCDGFERYPGPWVSNAGGGGIEMQDMEAPRCGLASAYMHVEPADTFAHLQADVASTGQELTSQPHSLRSFVHVAPGCTEQGEFVRVIELRVQQDGGLWYRWVVAVNGAQLRLSGSDHFANTADWLADAPLPDAWVELRLDFDFGTETPSAQLYVDEVLTVETDNQAPLIDGEAFIEPAAPTVMIGPFFFDAPFAVECTMRYDEVSVATQ